MKLPLWRGCTYLLLFLWTQKCGMLDSESQIFEDRVPACWCSYLWWKRMSLVLNLPGASVRNSTHGKGHEEGDLGIRKGGIEPQETPCSWASTPQTQSLPTLLFYALTYTSDFTGGWPPLPLSEKELTYGSKSIKIPGRDKSVSTYELLWRLSSLPVQVRPATCNCLQPPNCERHEMFQTY